MMVELTSEGQEIADELAHRYAVSVDAVATLFTAIAEGRGKEAHFSHPDLGGEGGHWTLSGMIQIGDMYNKALKTKVDELCNAIWEVLHNKPLLAMFASSGPRSRESRHDQSGQSQTQSTSRDKSDTRGAMGMGFVMGGAPKAWWPAELGTPATTGSREGVTFAFFPARRRLAIKHPGGIAIFDAGNHDIRGFSEDRAEDHSVMFTSQHGFVSLEELPDVTNEDPADAPHQEGPQPSATLRKETVAPVVSSAPSPAAANGGDVLALIERLADLRRKDVITDEEFAAKKAELLGRL
jgi:hypothetical protein